MLIKFFDSKCGEIYLRFVHGLLGLFNKTILTMEKTNATTTDIVLEINKLKTNLKERRDNVFIPHGAKKLLKALEENGESQENLIRKEFSRFYDCCLSYIELWGNSFGDGERFVWLAKSIFDWSDIGAALEKNNETVANAVINIDDLFNEMVLAKAFWLLRSAEAEWKEKDCKEK